MIPQDVLLALIVLVLLFGTIIGLVYWARGGAPHDDGTGMAYRSYLPPAADEDEGWAAPPAGVLSKLPGDEARGRPKPDRSSGEHGDAGDGASRLT